MKEVDIDTKPKFFPQTNPSPVPHREINVVAKARYTKENGFPRTLNVPLVQIPQM